MLVVRLRLLACSLLGKIRHQEIDLGTAGAYQLGNTSSRMITSIQPKVTSLKLPSGDHTEIGQETCEEIMAKHFPSHIPKINPDYNHTEIVTTEITKSDFKPWTT